MNVRRGDDESLSRYNSPRIAQQTLFVTENPDEGRFVLAQHVGLLFGPECFRDFDVFHFPGALLQRFVGFEDFVEAISLHSDQFLLQLVAFFHQLVVRHVKAALARVEVVVDDAEPVFARRGACIEAFIAAESELRAPELRELVDFLHASEVWMQVDEFVESEGVAMLVAREWRGFRLGAVAQSEADAENVPVDDGDLAREGGSVTSRCFELGSAGGEF